MPLPISTVFLVIFAVLWSSQTVFQIIGCTLAGLAVLNELLRFVFSRPTNEYEIPAVPRNRTIRSPLVDDDGS